MSDFEFLRPDINPQQNQAPFITHHDEGELAVDVYETSKAVFIKTAIAGVTPENLSISLADDILTIRGARHDLDAPHPRNYLCQECHWGNFSRTIILPADVNTAKAEATFKSGLLLIKLPKSKNKNEIRVKVEDEE